MKDERHISNQNLVTSNQPSPLNPLKGTAVEKLDFRFLVFDLNQACSIEFGLSTQQAPSKHPASTQQAPSKHPASTQQAPSTQHPAPSTHSSVDFFPTMIYSIARTLKKYVA
jgi:hypothetical protein